MGLFLKHLPGMDVVVMGEAEEIKDEMASGYRVAAGITVMLKLTP